MIYHQVNEIRFVRDVVRSGLSDAQIEYSFAQLPRPMDFDLAQVAYSFMLGWVMGAPRPTPEDVIQDHHLAELAKAENAERLIELKEQIEGLLERIAPPETNEDDDDS